MGLIIFLAIWAGVHVYLVSRLLSIPFISYAVNPAAFSCVVALMGASYLLARLLEHYRMDGVAHVLEYVGATWIGAAFLLFVGLVAADLVTGFGLWLRGAVPLVRTVGVLAAMALVAVAMVQAWRAPVVTEYTVKLAGLPQAANGTVLVAASDMHLGPMLGQSWARARARQMEALHPDAVLLVGDIFEGDETTYERWLSALKEFRAPKGVFMVTGNHERYAGAEKIVGLFQQAGVKVLRNESTELVPGLVLSGVDDPSFHGRRRHAAVLEQTLNARPGGASRPGATILMSHTPVGAEEAARLGVGLMLSGHTHAGQIWPFNYLVRAAFPRTDGRYDVNGMTEIICRGTGTWGPRMRLWRRSEMVRITMLAS